MLYFHYYETSDIRHQQEAVPLAGAAISAMSSPIVGAGFTPARERLSLANNLTFKLCLLSLLCILFSKPAMAYELKWSTTIIVSGQQTNATYSLQGASSFVGGPPSSSPTYTVTTYPLPPQQLAFTIFTATPVSSAMVRLNWNDLQTEEYYSLQRNGILIASHIPKNTILYDDTYSLKADTAYTYALTAYGTGTNIIATATCNITTPKSSHKFIPYHNLFHPLNGEKVQIYYEIDSSVSVTIKLYDLTGELVKELVNGCQQTGKYWVEWDGKDKDGEKCDAGVYIIQIQAGDLKDMRKIILVK